MKLSSGLIPPTHKSTIVDKQRVFYPATYNSYEKYSTNFLNCFHTDCFPAWLQDRIELLEHYLTDDLPTNEKYLLQCEIEFNWMNLLSTNQDLGNISFDYTMFDNIGLLKQHYEKIKELKN